MSEPVIDGSAVLPGMSAPIRSVADDADEVEPPAFFAVTRTLTVEPIRLVSSFSVEPVASEILLQLAPLALHCCHW